MGVSVGDGGAVRVMDLDALREAKEHLEATHFGHSEDGQIVASVLRAVLDSEPCEIECAVCEGMGEVFGCPENSPDICVSCDHGDLTHVIDCPECGGSGVWSVIRDPIRRRLLAEDR